MNLRIKELKKTLISRGLDKEDISVLFKLDPLLFVDRYRDKCLTTQVLNIVYTVVRLTITALEFTALKITDRAILRVKHSTAHFCNT